MKNAPIGWSLSSPNSLMKLFHFSDEKQMEEFCLRLLKQTHKKASKVVATECHTTCQIKVEIISPTEKLSIASCVEKKYNELLNNEEENEDKTIWDRIFSSE
jgi:hypothetical protein